MKIYDQSITSGDIQIFEGVCDDIVIDHYPIKDYKKDRAFFTKPQAKKLAKLLLKLAEAK